MEGVLMTNAKRMLQPNQCYPENTSFFNIIRYLGEGRTAYVYHALDQQGKHRALKVMHTDLNSDMQRMFKGEKDTLRQLTSGLAVLNEHLTPSLYENYDLSQVSGTHEFIAQELVTGKQIVNLVEVGEALPEKTGTIIVEKFALVLQVLHEDMQKTYSDMKYQNIWWLEDEESIRVTDWNVIDDYSEEGMKQDLLKFATYAARILVGQKPRTQGKLITEDIRKNPNWEKLSFGAQYFLRKALHTNPKYRYQSAKEMHTDLLTLTQAWAWERNEMVKALLDVLDRAESKGKDEYKEALLSYQKAKMLLEIAGANTNYRLRPADREEYAHRISRGISGTDFIAIGLEFYASTDYKRALENFEQGYQKGSGDIALYRRWRDLGRMAIGIGEDFADFARTLHDAVKELNDDNYSAAVRLFDVASILDASMAQQINALKTERDTINIRENFERVSASYPEFSLLYVEALAWERLRDADNHQGSENYAEATALYAQSASLFSLLPEELKVFVPNIQEQEIEASRLADLGSAFTNTIARAETEVQHGDIRVAIPLYEEVYKQIVRNVRTPSLNPSDKILEPLWASMLAQGEYLLQQEHYEAGKELLRLGLSYYPDYDKFRIGVWQAEQLIQLTAQDVVNNPIKGFDTLNYTLNYVRDFSSLTVLKGVLSQRLDIVLEQLTEMGEHVLAQRLVAGTKKADQKWWQDEVEERYREKVQIKKEETERQIRSSLTAMGEGANLLATMSNQGIEVGSNIDALEEQISHTRALVAQLPSSSPADEFLRKTRMVERLLMEVLPEPKAERVEETKALRAAQDALSEARGQLDLAAQKTLRASYAIWGNDPIRWYDFVEEVKELAQKAEQGISKARRDLAVGFDKPNSQASPLYTKLKELDTQLAEQETQLGSLKEERHKKEEEKLLIFIAETENLLLEEKYSQAARVLTRMTPLVKKHPKLAKKHSALERRFKQEKKDKFITKPMFWIMQAGSFVLLLCLSLFMLINTTNGTLSLPSLPADEYTQAAIAAAGEAKTAAETAKTKAAEAKNVPEEKSLFEAQTAATEAQVAVTEAQAAVTESQIAVEKGDLATAQTAATKAQTVADEAKTKADEAQAAATEAQAAADEAQTTVTEAQTAVDEAKTKADEARNAATETNRKTAQTAADEAQTAADEAQTAVTEAQTAVDITQKIIDNVPEIQAAVEGVQNEITKTQNAVANLEASEAAEIAANTCDSASYPANLVYLGGEGTAEEGKGTVIWRFQNQSGCYLTDFATTGGPPSNFDTDSTLPDFLWYSNILTITHKYVGATDVVDNHILTFKIDGAEMGIPLLFTVPKTPGAIETLPAEGETVLEYYSDMPISILSTVSTSRDNSDGYGTHQMEIEWQVTNNTNMPLTVLTLLNSNKNSIEATSEIFVEGIYIPLADILENGHNLPPGETVTIKATANYTPGAGTSLTRYLKVTDGENEIELPLAEELNMDMQAQ